jgi:Uma2 family endonuclease
LVRKERFAGAQIPVMAEFAPDVAFEVHSPSDKPSEIQSKRKDYQQSGVIQVWIDPDKRLVELVYPHRPLEYFQEGQPLIIAGLTDFSLDLEDLFAI